MVLVALHRMGASDERLEAYCHIYQKQNGLVPVPEPIGRSRATIGAYSWGSASAKATIARFFASEVGPAWRNPGCPPTTFRS